MYKILVVDDDAISLAICKALMENNYEVITAKSGVEALGCLNRGCAPDAILLDMMMPGLNGMDFLKMLKNEERWKDIPVLFLSSMDDEKFEVEGFKNGAVDFLGKPVQIDLLQMKLNRQLYFAKLKREHQWMKQKLTIIKKQLLNFDLPSEEERAGEPESDSAVQ